MDESAAFSDIVFEGPLYPAISMSDFEERAKAAYNFGDSPSEFVTCVVSFFPQDLDSISSFPHRKSPSLFALWARVLNWIVTPSLSMMTGSCLRDIASSILLATWFLLSWFGNFFAFASWHGWGGPVSSAVLCIFSSSFHYWSRGPVMSRCCLILGSHHFLLNFSNCRAME